MAKGIKYYSELPVVFDGFMDFPELSDGVIRLISHAKKPAIPEKKYVPAYDFTVWKDCEKIGDITLRIGYSDSLFYSGQIGYEIDAAYRGNGYAVRACRLLRSVAKAHRMQKLLITTDYRNSASKRVCEKLGAKLLQVLPLPQWHELYEEGGRFVHIFVWNMEQTGYSPGGRTEKPWDAGPRRKSWKSEK